MQQRHVATMAMRTSPSPCGTQSAMTATAMTKTERRAAVDEIVGAELHRHRAGGGAPDEQRRMNPIRAMNSPMPTGRWRTVQPWRGRIEDLVRKPVRTRRRTSQGPRGRTATPGPSHRAEVILEAIETATSGARGRGRSRRARDSSRATPSEDRSSRAGRRGRCRRRSSGRLLPGRPARHRGRRRSDLWRNLRDSGIE